MAAPRMKPPTKKKKTPVKKTKVGTVKSPEETRKSISRKQVGTQRPARGGTGGARAQYLKGPKKPGTSLTVTNRPLAKVGEKAVEKIGTSITKPKGGGMGLIKGLGVGQTLLLVASPSFMSEKTGGKANYGEKEAIAKGLGSPMKSSMPGGYGSKTSGYGPTPKRKSSESSSSAQIGLNKPPRWREDAAWKYNAPIGPKKPKSSGGAPFSKGKGTAALPKGKSSPSSTAATTAAASGSNGGGSQAANVAKAGGKAKAKVGKQTKYQRESLAMEQRKSSSGTNVSKPKKSIFSLFRKG